MNIEDVKACPHCKEKIVIFIELPNEAKIDLARLDGPVIDERVKETSLGEPLFIAPCNITKNNVMEYNVFNKELVCVRYKCGKIKWKKGMKE